MARSRRLKVTCATSLETLRPLADRWNALAGGMPFRGWEWNSTWWRHYADRQRQLFVLLAHDAQRQLVGIAPCFVERSMLRGRRVRFLGSGEVCSDYTSLLAAPGAEQQVADNFADWLDGPGRPHWDRLDLDGQSADDLAGLALAEAMRRRHHAVEIEQQGNTWRVTLPSDWAAYVASLGRSPRSKVRKLERRMEADGGFQLCEVKSMDDFYRGFNILVELHQKRREFLGEPGCFASARFTSFHADIMRQLLGKGGLRLAWIEHNRRPIAIEYCLRSPSEMYYYQGGFDPAAADENPGWLQFMASIRGSIDAGCTTYDFLRGDEPYKALWQAQPRPLMRVQVIGRDASSRLRYAAEGTAQSAWRFAASRLRQPSVTTSQTPEPAIAE
ncbi:MAG: GNAT family N-acetyltransferase [Planctomycetes bacterium]|nr:GNAT family N-acetyltransferase [Planctomycetota bacterium]